MSLDALVIGGGFFGTAIACYLVERRGLSDVCLVERESDLLMRASYNNQARVHNGYHYPRSYVTAYRSRINFPRFLSDFSFAIRDDFVKLYAIASSSSRVSPRQFVRFFRDIGAPLESASAEHMAMFDTRRISAVFRVNECAFDAVKLRHWAAQELSRCGVELRLGCTARSVETVPRGGLGVTLKSNGGDTEELVQATAVFNCTYSGLNQFGSGFIPTATRLKHEITEMALLSVPPALSGLGITVMDGPFFSCMPFPPLVLHSLSHVRYTPHSSWSDSAEVDPSACLNRYAKVTRVERMMRDTSRYLPVINECDYRMSLFEVKTVLQKSESDDGRPILFERHPVLPNFYSILGGKLDNIYDIFERLDDENFR